MDSTNTAHNPKDSRKAMGDDIKDSFLGFPNPLQARVV